MADLHIGVDRADDVEVAAVAAAIGDDPAVVHETDRLVRGGPLRRHERRHLLLPALHALQAAKGWISPGGLNHVADRLQVPPAEAHGVATFYAMFSTTEPERPGDVTHVCVDPVCRIEGAEDLATSIEADGGRVHRSPCLGGCDRAPATFVQGVGAPDRVPADDATPEPVSIDAYRAGGGYAALARAIEAGPDTVIEEIVASGLSGRGGAAFPTGTKWRAVAVEPGPRKHVVANCDESEPGTFKDRVLLEDDPFAVVEAMTIAGLTVGAEHGWVYLRGEYPRATARLTEAIEQARAAGLLGPDLADTGQAFDLEVRRGAGAYICGEETALFASIEGFRGEPRSKPPFPTTHGLFGEPTVINNPETLVNALGVIGGQSPDTRRFSVSGRVARPGVYEVDLGTPLRRLVSLAGGVTGSGELAAVLLGGAAGAFVGPDRLDLPLTLEDTRAAGLTLGSGAVMVFDTSVDLTDVVVRLSEFFREESCGQCVPCRVGTVRQHEAMVELRSSGSLDAGRRQLVDDVRRVMADASICGLGHTAASAVTSALDLGLIGRSP